jgi:hypothetical protein
VPILTPIACGVGEIGFGLACMLFLGSGSVFYRYPGCFPVATQSDYTKSTLISVNAEFSFVSDPAGVGPRRSSEVARSGRPLRSSSSPPSGSIFDFDVLVDYKNSVPHRSSKTCTERGRILASRGSRGTRMV